jgi:hypothetical protein
LTIGDLSDQRRGSLGLAIRNLCDNGSRSLGLAIGDLSGDRSRCLRLTIGNLSDDRSRCLRLTIGDLGNDGGLGGLGLTIGDLSDGRANRGSLRLAVGNLRDTAGAGARHGSLNVNGYALSTSRLAVKVVEVTRLALVEDGGAHEGHGAVAAKTEAISLLGIRLNRRVKLELVVASDVASATSLVGQLAVLEGDLKCAIKLTPFKATPGGSLGGIDGSDGEVARCGGGAVRSGGGLGEGSNSSGEAESDK